MSNISLLPAKPAELTAIPAPARSVFRRRIIVALTATAAAFSFAAPAGACELICQITKARYNGNLGGYNGADAKCETEFKGFKFPRSLSLVQGYAAVRNQVYYVPNYGPFITNPWGFYPTAEVSPRVAWTGGDAVEYNSSNHNCSNWTSSMSSYKGGSISGNNQGSGSNISNTYYTGGIYYGEPWRCDDTFPLVCCNIGG